MNIDVKELDNIDVHDIYELNKIIVGYLKKRKARGTVYIYYEFKDGPKISNIEVIE
jgi:hypothetical protein